MRFKEFTDSLPIRTGHLFIIGALVLAVISAVLVKNLASQKPDHKVALDTVPVVVATQAIASGKALSGEDLKVVQWPKNYLPLGSIYERPSDLIGRIVQISLLPGEPIYRQKLAGENSKGGLPVIIPNGMRATSVGVSEIKDVAGFVKPGDHVDVLTTYTVRHESEDVQVTKTVLQDVLVLATAQEMLEETVQNPETPAVLTSQEPEDPKEAKKKARQAEREAKKAEKTAKNKLASTVTLALWPEQVEALVLAQEMGEVHLSLRPEGEHAMADLGGVTSVSLSSNMGMGGSVVELQEPDTADATTSAAPPANSIEFIQGTDKTAISF